MATQRDDSPTPPRHGPLSRLDPLETNPPEPLDSSGEPAPQLDDPDVAFRHSGWSHTRARVRAALASAGVSESRLQSFDSCGSHCWVVRDAERPDRFRLVSDNCHDRFCQPCATARSHGIARALAPRVRGAPHRHVVLTLRSTDESLDYLLRHLYASFTKLRRTKLWQGSIDGGCAFCEIKWIPAKRRWHPHLHCICEGRYLPKQALSDAWLACTGTSIIVHVGLIEDREKTIRYITKYASKPLHKSFSHLSDRLLEAVKALHGRRLCLTFGSWRGTPLMPAGDETDWVYVCPLSQLRREAADGSVAARAIFTRLRHPEAWLPRPPPGHPHSPIDFAGIHVDPTRTASTPSTAPATST